MKSMTVGRRLGISVGALVAILGISSWVGLSAVASLGSQLELVVNVRARQIDLKQAVGKRFQEAQADGRGVLIGYLRNSADRIGRNSKSMDAAVARIHQQVMELRAMAEAEEDRREADQIERIVNDWSEGQKTLAAAAAAGQFQRVDELLDGTLRARGNELEDLVARAVKRERDELTQSSKAAAMTIGRSRWTAFGVILAAIAICFAVAVVIRKVNRALRQAVSELSRGAEQVAVAASQVSSSSQSLAQGASEQAASLEETSASSEEINSMARRNSESSCTVAGLMTKSEQKFVDTNQSLEVTVAAMGEIDAHSGKISNIIKTIDEIAFQTNILALNAAVEAARAGEAGMGFAVVADEVRSLSQRCSQAAKDTAALIDESVSKSRNGKAKVDQVAAAIRAISGDVAHVKALLDDVNQGSQEQARGIEQIGKAISQMEQVTQRAAASAEESAAAAEELNSQSEMLKNIVHRLTSMIGRNEVRSPSLNKQSHGRSLHHARL